MAKFRAKNETKSTTVLTVNRKRYDVRAFPENNSLGPVGVVDFLFAERNLYGRVDENLNVVVPNQESLKTVVAPENPTGITLMNFVADQFSDFQATFQRALNGGKIRSNDPYLSSPRAYSVFKSPKDAYEKYFSNIIINFEKVFLKKQKVISAGDYFKEFLHYVNQITPTFPVTYTSWYRSRYSSIFYSGLAIDLSGLDIGNDSLKETFINSENFPYYLNVCNNFGFSVAKNSPWIIVADLASPSSTLYHRKYNLSSISQIFSENFIQTHTLDVDYIKRNLFDAYNNFSSKYPYEKNITPCKKKTIKNNVYRNNININKFNNIYNNNYFIEYYNNIRYYEEEPPYSISDINRFSANAKNLEKTFDISRAIGYINEQYRSVYKSKPGGLNSILRKVDSKDRPKQDLEETRGASVSSGGSTGGSGGSSGY